MKLRSRNLLRSTLHAVLVYLVVAAGALQTKAQDGEALYKANCAACHKIDQDLVGPALKGIHERQSEEWLIKWIRNSQAVIKSGDQYAVDLYAKWNNVAMPAYDWTDDEIKSVLAYIKDEGSKAAAASASASADGGSLAATNEPEGLAGNKILMLVIIVVSVLLIFVLLGVQKSLKKKLEERIASGEINQDQYQTLIQKYKVPNYVFLLVGLSGFGAFMVLGGYYLAVNVGNQQGYAPTQPINFSHELHAGKHNIQCSYCHTGVERGKSATIPAANICMNCHNQIKKESPEIKKIYAAIENNQPIQWVRIHNLQDFAYFNHYQHYKVAGIECQTCHGQIQEMEVVAQHSNLTMGWCINCHRETKVNLENGYYQEVHGNKEKFQKALKENGLTISQLGGLECSKCHY